LDMLASLGEWVGRRENTGSRVPQLSRERRHALRKGLAGRKSSVGLFARKSSACRARSRKLFFGRNFAGIWPPDGAAQNEDCAGGCWGLAWGRSREAGVSPTMKKCPYCAEEIQDEAIKCRHCGEFLDDSGSRRVRVEKSGPWYFGTTPIVLALATVGPLALPLVWVHPKLKPLWKIVITLLVLAVSWWAFREVQEYLKYFDEMRKMLEGK